MSLTPSSSSGGGAVSGVTVTGTAASGQVPVASSSSAGAWAYPPGYEIGYDQITGSVNVASTTEATGTTIITCAAHTFDGAPVIAEFFSPACSTGTTLQDVLFVCLFESSTQIGRICLLDNPAAAQAICCMTGKLRFTPTAGSHTYTVTAFATSTTGTPNIGAGAGGTSTNVPAYIRFTKV